MIMLGMMVALGLLFFVQYQSGCVMGFPRLGRCEFGRIKRYAVGVCPTERVGVLGSSSRDFEEGEISSVTSVPRPGRACGDFPLLSIPDSTQFNTPKVIEMSRDSETFANFRRVVKQLRAIPCNKPEEAVCTMSKEVDALLKADCGRFMSDLIAKEPTPSSQTELRNVFDFMLSFLEHYVDEMKNVESHNAKIVKDVILAAKGGARELDDSIKQLVNAGKMNYGILQYLDTEAARLKVKEEECLAQGVSSQELVDMQGIIGVVRSRMAAEVEAQMGCEVAVLSRLLGFDDRYLMRSALRQALEKNDNTEQGGEEGSNGSGAGDDNELLKRHKLLFQLARETLDDLETRDIKDNSLKVKLRDIMVDIDDLAGGGLLRKGLYNSFT